MVTKESPADKAKREAAEKAEKQKLDATKDTGSGDDVARLSDVESKDKEVNVEDQTTDTGAEVIQAGPVAIEKPDEINNDPLTEDELKDLVGELEPGEVGFLPLDRLGRITGPAKRGRPGADELGATVQAVIQRVPLTLQTPSGAPILRHMNPSYPTLVKPRYG